MTLGHNAVLTYGDFLHSILSRTLSTSIWSTTTFLKCWHDYSVFDKTPPVFSVVKRCPNTNP